MRNMDSRQRYQERMEGLLKDAIEAKAAQERNDQIQALNLVDDVLGPKNWDGWENSSKQRNTFKVNDALASIQNGLKHQNVKLLLENQRALDTISDQFSQNLGKTVDKDLVELFKKGDGIRVLKEMSGE